MFAATALAATSITMTFVRHAESQANADGVIDTKVPGPHLSDPVGVAQAQAIANVLVGNGYDGIWASDMIRTQETAQPLADLLDKSISVRSGLHEIDAGVYEGSSEDDGWGRLGYAATPLLWTLGLRFATMPGSTDADGNVFQHRVADAVQDIYDSGQQNPVVFSHGATIMFWTLMNVDNPDLFLLFTHPLNNTSVVVIDGNPEDGWKLVNWDGVSVDAEPSLLMKMFVDLRNLIVAPQEAAYTVSHALASGDLFEAAAGLIKAAIQLGVSPIDFVVSVATDLINEIFKPANTSGVSTAVSEAAAPEPAARLAAVPDPATREVTPSVGTQLAVTSGTAVAESELATATAESSPTAVEPAPAAVEQTESAAPATTEATAEEVTDQDQAEDKDEETATPATDSEDAEATKDDAGTEATDPEAIDAAADDDTAAKDDQSESDAAPASTSVEDTTASSTTETHSTAATSDATDHVQDAAA